MLLKSAVFGVLLFLQFWIPTVYSAVGDQGLQHREYTDELIGRQDADDGLAPLENTPRGLEVQHAAFLAAREALEDALEAFFARTQGQEALPGYDPGPLPAYEPPPPAPGYDYIMIEFRTPDRRQTILLGQMPVLPGGEPLQNLKDFVALNIEGTDLLRKTVKIQAKDLLIKYRDLTIETSFEWIPVPDGVVPDYKKHQTFLVIWNKKLLGLIPYKGRFKAVTEERARIERERPRATYGRGF